MSLQPNFNIENLDPLRLQHAEVKINSYLNSGRLFRLHLEGMKSIPYTLNELIKRVLEIIHQASTNNYRDLNALKAFVVKLKKANHLSNQKDIHDLSTLIQNKVSDLHPIDDSKRIVKKVKRDPNDLESKENDSNALIHAARTGDLVLIQSLLQNKKIDINYMDKDGATPLMSAIILDKTKVIEIFLQDKKIHPNLKDKQGCTPLIYATKYKKPEIAQLLIQHETIDVNAQDNLGDTPLILSITRELTEIAQLLLQHEKIDVNHQDKYGNSPLMLAINHGLKEVVKTLLLHNKINVNQLNSESQTAFVKIKTEKKNDIVKIMKELFSPRDLLIQKEMLKLITLAHSTHLAGNGQIQLMDEEFPSISIELEGLTNFYAYKKMKNATTLFSELNELAENESIHLQEFVECGFLNSNSHTLDRIRNGLPVSTPTGFFDHSVCVLIWGSYFILCNRGYETRRVVEIYRCNSKKINSAILERIKKAANLSSDLYKNLFFKELPKILEFQPQGPFEKSFEELCTETLNKQTVGNCSWAAPEAGVFAFFALFNLLANSQGQLNKPIPSSIHSQQADPITKKFIEWQSFMQTFSLENYLGVHHLRSNHSKEKIETSKQRRKTIAIDYAVTISAIKAIKSIDKREPHFSLQQILTKSISLSTSRSLEESWVIAKEILDSIDTIKPEEMKAKICKI